MLSGKFDKNTNLKCINSYMDRFMNLSVTKQTFPKVFGLLWADKKHISQRALDRSDMFL